MQSWSRCTAIRWTEFTHAVRAAGAQLGTTDVLVVGSQAILASFDEDVLPDQVTISNEIDICGLADYDGSRSEELAGALGEDSRFHQLHGFFIDGVGYNTVRGPFGWESRLVKVSTSDMAGVTAHCIGPTDLCVAKLVAGRQKDLAFVGAMIRARLVNVAAISELIYGVRDITETEVAIVHGRLTGLAPSHVPRARPTGLPPVAQRP